MPKTLIECSVGDFAKIENIKKEPRTISRRLMELGFVKDVKVKVLKKSILGKTLLIEIENYVLTIRSSVAEMVIVK